MAINTNYIDGHLRGRDSATTLRASGEADAYLPCSWIFPVVLILVVVSAGAFVKSLFDLPNVLYYLADAANVMLFILAFRRVATLGNLKGMKLLVALAILFILSTIIGIVLNGVPALYAAWGIRNVFRCMLFFASCSALLNAHFATRFVDLLPKVYAINFCFVLVEYFAFGYRGDYLGGIFGMDHGCNGGTIVFTNICMAYFLTDYLQGRLKIGRLGFYTVIYFAIAGLAELKGNFVYFCILVVLASLLCRKGWRQVTLTACALVAIYVGATILESVFPGSFSTIINLDSANSYMDASYFGYTTFTRNHQLDVANLLFFKDNPQLYLFGYGMGACDMCSFFETPFYSAYGYMNYRSYGVSMTLLQTGYIGLLLYFAFFVVVGFQSWLLLKGRPEFQRYRVATVLIAVFAVIQSFYSTLYLDMSYWVYFFLAIPFMLVGGEARS